MISQTDNVHDVTTTYTYDDRNRLTEVTTGGTVVATYTYDALNSRIGVDDNGTQTWTVYDGDQSLRRLQRLGVARRCATSMARGVVNGAVTTGLLARTSAAARRPGI